MSFDPIAFKQQFPLFSQTENEDLVYLDNAATTQKPQCVIDALGHFYSHNNGNAQRSSHRLARQATNMIDTVREQARVFLGANKKEDIVFTQGATHSINMIAYGLRKQLTANDCIAVSYGEHHANLLPWQEVSHATDCELMLASPTLDELTKKTAGNTKNIKVIAISLASNALGTQTDIATLHTIKKHYPNSIIVLDITQWLAHQPITLSALPCDFAACSAHKFYGPTGLGLLYGKYDYLAKLEPLLTGGEMVDTVSPQKSLYHSGYRGLEAGTSSMAAIASLGACLAFWAEQDRNAMAAHEALLTQHLHQQLQKICKKNSYLSLLTQAKNNIGIASIACNAPYSIADLALWLDKKNIAVRAGEHCTQLLWKKSHAHIKGGTLRLSIAAYNTLVDINAVVAAIEEYCDMIDNADSTNTLTVFETMDWQALLDKKSWQQRYKQLILWGRSMDEQAQIRQPAYFIKGCESSVWLKHHLNNEKHYFIVDSDSAVIKGLAALVLCRINNKSTKEIETIDFDTYFNSIGLSQHLSESRQNGFNSLFQAMINFTKKS